MLTKDLAIIRLDRWTAHPDQLGQRKHRHYLEPAKRAVEVYQSGAGKSRDELHRQVREIFEVLPDCPEKRAEAFCKLLDEDSKYDDQAKRIAPKLRRDLWSAAAKHHPLVSQVDELLEKDEREVKAAIAEEIGKPWEHLAAQMWADVIECQRLVKFEGSSSPESLLSRYNVAQYQAALFHATEVVIDATRDLKIIVRAAKLARLLLEIERVAEGQYRFKLSGAASTLRDTRRYGAEIAKFFPSLLSCRGWNLCAKLMMGRSAHRWTLSLSSEDGLSKPELSPEQFDSKVERQFWERWHSKERNGWRLSRESDLLWKAQAVILPDFSLLHPAKETVYVEIVGFWTPEYLNEKVAKLQFIKPDHLLVLVPEKSWRADLAQVAKVMTYKTVIRPEHVLKAVNEMMQQ